MFVADIHTYIYIKTCTTAMPSKKNTSTLLPSSASAKGGGIVGGEGKHDLKLTSRPPSEESTESPTVTYDPPPASWFFNRGSSIDRKPVQEQNSPAKNAQEKDEASSSSSPSNEFPFAGTNDRRPNPGPEFGMVSDNDEDDDSHEGFNFIAVSKSLLMVDPSFDPSSEDTKEPAKVETDAYSSEVGSEKHRGVLIVDGCGSVSDARSEDGSPVVDVDAQNNPDSSMLTVPGTDSLPSEIGSISSGDGIPEQGGQNKPNEDALEDPHLEDQPSLIHRFLNNLQQNRRLRVVSDASDVDGGDRGSVMSFVRNDDEDVSVAWTTNGIEDHFRGVPRKLAWRRWFLPVSIFGFLFATAFACHSFVVSQRKQKEAWEQRLREEKEAMARILAEKESLRHEMEMLVEEAAFATARAESLVREQARLILQKEEAEKAEKERLRLLKEEEEKKQKDRQRRREQPWRSSNEESFGWFFDDSEEDCSERRNDGSSSFTIVDNCWVKAKADVNLGSCSSDTKDYFNDIWSSLLGDWKYYFDDSTSGNALDRYSAGGSNGEVNSRLALPSGKQAIDYDKSYDRVGNEDDQQNRGGDSGDQGRHYQYQDDTYYPPQDPLQDLFSAFHSAGQSFVNKLSNLVSDEVETSHTIAREMEETVSRRYLEASQTISTAMEIAKEDMRELSKETLSVIRTAVQKGGSAMKSRTSQDAKDGTKHPPPPTQQVTMKGLFDAAAAVTTLFESVVGDNTEK